MQFFPIEYYVVDVTRWNPLLQWIEFRGGRHWMRRSEKDVSFYAGLATEKFEFDIESLRILNGYGNEIRFEIQNLTHVPKGFSNFDWLPDNHKAIVDIRIPFNDDKMNNFPLTGYLETPDNEKEPIFSLQPKILSPDFLFEAVAIYGPKLSPRFTDFVETGSLFAHTSIHASFWFDHVTTIEISDFLYEFIKELPSARPNIRVLHGDSPSCMPEVLARLQGPTVFFLDAHWSGDDTTNYLEFDGYPHPTGHKGKSKTPNSKEQKPILQELQQIYEGCKFPALIIIDDWNLMGLSDDVFEGFDWTHLSQDSLKKFIDDQLRTAFQAPLGTTRYIIGLS